MWAKNRSTEKIYTVAFATGLGSLDNSLIILLGMMSQRFYILSQKIDISGSIRY